MGNENTKTSRAKRSIELSFEIGKQLLENGAEISRVQETMERVAGAYHVEDFNAYVLTNAIFVSGMEEGEQRTSALKHIKQNSIDLSKISALNQLSREISKQNLPLDVAYKRLERINASRKRPLYLLAIACGMGGAAFCFMVGGGITDTITAFVCGVLLELLLSYLNSKNTSKFLLNLVASAFVSLIAALLYLAGFCHNLDKAIIGAILRLVPGVALTNSIRDFFNGDFLSGSIRLIDALVVGCCVGVGVGSVIRLMSMLTGGVMVW